MSKKIKYHFIVVGWNCALYLEECIDSILNQSNNNDISYTLHIRDDFSDDSTWELLQKYKNIDNLYLSRNSVNMGAAYSRYDLIKNLDANDQDVIILVDMDDYLKANAIEYIDNVYRSDNNIELTYGSWITTHGKKCKLKYLEKDTFINKDFEEKPYVGTHLRTFKVFLRESLSPEYFKIDGNWIKNATDVPLMILLMKFTSNINAIKPIEEVLYVYRQKTQNSTSNKFGRKNKLLISREIRKKIRNLNEQ